MYSAANRQRKNRPVTMTHREQKFIPATMARAIGGGVFFRPIKSWHSATYAGERLNSIPGSSDRSGCMDANERSCSIPLSVTHRLYWHKRDPEKTISAFLSYPDGMGCCSEYFWEVLGIDEDGHEYDDVTRWTGNDAETDMETAIKSYFAAAA